MDNKNNETGTMNNGCDMEKPFVFFSYSHADAELVSKIAEKLRGKGFNIWMDREGIRHDGKSWTSYARSALLHENCRVIVFFRSESSLLSKPCLNELETAAARKGDPLSPLCVDIWDVRGMTAEKQYQAVRGNAKYDSLTADVCREILTIADKLANAVRLWEDCDGSAMILSEKLAEILQKEKGLEAAPAPVPRKTHRIDWMESFGGYDYFYGAFEIYDDVTGSNELIGYTPSIGIKRYHVDNGRRERFVVFVHDRYFDGYLINDSLGGDDFEYETCAEDTQEGSFAFVCEDNSTVENFLQMADDDEDDRIFRGGHNGAWEEIFLFVQRNGKILFRASTVWDDERLGELLFSAEDIEDMRALLAHMDCYKMMELPEDDEE